MRAITLILRPAVWIPLCIALWLAFRFGPLPAWLGFVVWSLLIGAGFGLQAGYLRSWMDRFPAEGYFAGRRRVRATGLLTWGIYFGALAQFHPLFGNNLRAWCFALKGDPDVALLHALGMWLTMAVGYLLLPRYRDEPKRMPVLRLGWIITLISFGIFYVGLNVSLAFVAPRILPLMVTLLLTPVAFCLLYVHARGA